MSGWNEWESLDFLVVLVQGEGIHAIVNTGPPVDLDALNRGWAAFAGPRCRMIREAGETPQEILASVGLTPADITHVLLTPLQLYATANVMLFPNAQICMLRRGWIEDVMARKPWLHVPRPLCIDDDTLRYLIFDAQDRLRLLDDEDEVCPGIHASWVGTHHRSSALYTFETSRGRVGVSDCAFKYGNLNGHPLGIGESLEEGYRAYRCIQREVQHFIPLYDPEVLHRYPGGVIAPEFVDTPRGAR
jgi:hypothetical protein